MSRNLVCNPERMNAERMGAWGLVIGGGLFWTIAAFSGPYSFVQVSLTSAVGTALVPLGLTLIVFALGLWSEVSASLLLFGLTIGGIVWGIAVGWEPALWTLMLTVFALPMGLAGVLYYLAWRMEHACGGAKAAIGMLDLDL